MTTRSVSLALARAKLLETLDKHQIDVVASLCELREFNEGETIVRQGEPGIELFIILSGQVTVLVEDADLGYEYPILELVEGQTFGELSLLTRHPRAATVRADTSTLCACLNQLSFEKLLGSLPQVGVTICRYLAERINAQGDRTGLRFVKLTPALFDQRLYRLLPERVWQRFQAVPLRLSGSILTVAVTRPDDVAQMAALKQLLPTFDVRWVACGFEDYSALLTETILPGLAAASTDLRSLPVDEFCLSGNPQGPAAKLLASLFLQALFTEADELLLEPTSEGVRLRVRHQGRLKTLVDRDMTRESYPPLVDLLRSLTGLGPEDHHGSGTYVLRAKLHEFQVTFLATRWGPRTVVRFFSSGPGLSLTSLFRSKAISSLLAEQLQGGRLFLLSGGRGSGKSSTFYQILEEFCDLEEQSVVTIERRLLRGLQGVSQCVASWDSSRSMARLARAALAQNPDVLGLDEVTDPETAQLAVSAALNGACVLVVMREAEVESARRRFLELAGNPDLEAQVLRMVVCQRLVRKSCCDCRTEIQDDDSLRSHLQRAGLLTDTDLFDLRHSPGCDACAGTGVTGRMAAFEFLAYGSKGYQHRGIKAFGRELLSEGLVAPLEALRVLI